jgi:hypothetical protein
MGVGLLVPFNRKTWVEFLRRMEGPDGVDVQGDPNHIESLTWRCDHTHAAARRVMKTMGFTRSQIDEAIFCFEEEGGFCDCEILLNVTFAWAGAGS